MKKALLSFCILAFSHTLTAQTTELWAGARWGNYGIYEGMYYKMDGNGNCPQFAFAFEGYLPKERNLRIKKLKELDHAVQYSGQTKIFIETPYRNNHLLEDILSQCNGQTRLCIASNINGADESIQTKSIATWKKQAPDLNKKPTVFLLGR